LGDVSRILVARRSKEFGGGEIRYGIQNEAGSEKIGKWVLSFSDNRAILNQPCLLPTLVVKV